MKRGDIPSDEERDAWFDSRGDDDGSHYQKHKVTKKPENIVPAMMNRTVKMLPGVTDMRISLLIRAS